LYGNILATFFKAVKVAQYSLKKNGKFTIEMRIFGQLLLVHKQKVPYLYKTISKEFEFLHKSYATSVAMATMTFQDGGYFGFKVI
jgi:hypothetical protein